MGHAAESGGKDHGRKRRRADGLLWFTDQVISEVIDDLVAENPLDRGKLGPRCRQRLSAQRRPAHFATVDPEVQSVMENVWLEGKYWEPMPIENYDDPNDPDDTPRTITTQAAGVVINYKGELCGVVGGLGQKTENRGFNRGTEMERQVGSYHEGRRGLPLGIDMDLINYSSVLMDDYFPISDGKGGTRTDWPSNWSGRYSHSMTTVYEALKQSLEYGGRARGRYGDAAHDVRVCTGHAGHHDPGREFGRRSGADGAGRDHHRPFAL